MSYFIVFRPDGTGVSGFRGLRPSFNWHINNNSLYMDGIDVNIRVAGNAITLDRLGSTYTYVFYSGDFDVEESVGGVIVIIIILLIIILIGVPVGVTLLIVYLVRRKKRNAAQQVTYMQPNPYSHAVQYPQPMQPEQYQYPQPMQPDQPAHVKYCNECGYENTSGNFCSNCGKIAT